MAEPRPQLHAVPEPGEGAAASRDDSGREERGVRWVLAALLALAVMALIIQTVRARDLHTQVDALSSELSATRAELAAHQAHLGQVREQMGAFEGVLAELESATASLKAAVERDPATP